jgi:hypothetical protein
MSDDVKTLGIDKSLQFDSRTVAVRSNYRYLIIGSRTKEIDA